MYDYEQNVHNVPRRSRDEGFCRIQRQLTIHFKQPALSITKETDFVLY